MSLRRTLSMAFVLMISFSTALFAQPVITSLVPSTGPAAGGNSVAINGSGFTGATAVNFGTISAAFVFNSDNSITATAPPGTPGAINVSVTTGSGTSPSSAASRYVYQGDWFAYVTDQGDGSITAIDTTTNTPTSYSGIISLPNNIAITPDGKTAYITDGVDQIDVFDLATNTATTLIPLVSGSHPFAIAITPDGTTALVAYFAANYVTPIDIATNTAGAPIPLPISTTVPVCFDIAITPDGTTAYVTAFNDSLVIPLNLATSTAGAGISVPAPYGIAITPDGKTAYVASFGGGGTVVPITIATNTAGSPIGIGGPEPAGVSITPDGKTAYVISQIANNVTPIDIATNTARSPISVGITPLNMAVTPDSNDGYVTNNSDNTVTQIIVNTNTPGVTIPTGSGPVGIAISPDQAPIASFVATAMPGGFTTTFDASSSVSPVGTVTLYAWNFGDGQTFKTHSPVVTHTYQFGGQYIVTLTVTNSAGTSTTQVFTGHTVSNNGGPNATTAQLVDIGPTTPFFEGRAIKNKFLTQTDLTNKLTWDSNDPSIVGYLLYRNGVLLKTFTGNKEFEFIDHNRRKGETDVYTLIAFNAGGAQSQPVTIILTQKR